MGSVSIPVADVFSILTGDKTLKPSWQFIVLESRLPQAITAMLCGGALAVSGLMLQTAFRNPLAGPSIFGINSGAGLGVALVMLLLGGGLSVGSLQIGGFAAILRVRNWLLIVTGLLTAVTTAFCGPVAFIGLAVPHIARLLLTTDNHRVLLPATILCGAVVALICNLICFLPGESGVIPLNAVTPLIGAPVIIYVIARKR